MAECCLGRPQFPALCVERMGLAQCHERTRWLVDGADYPGNCRFFKLSFLDGMSMRCNFVEVKTVQCCVLRYNRAAPSTSTAVVSQYKLRTIINRVSLSFLFYRVRCS